jgi:hypothetical protein
MRRFADTDLEIAALAASQHGVVARRQLGLGESAIDRRLRSGRLVRLHRGVYAVGHPVLTADGHRLAAVLACGPDAVLSHASAAAAWGLRPSAAARTDVTVPSSSGRRGPRAVRLRRSRALAEDEVTTLRAIPITTPERTVLDLAATLTPRALERLLDNAGTAIDGPALEALADRHAGRAGTPTVLAALSLHHAGTPLTRSELEAAFLQFCDDRDIPRPQTNTYAEGFEIDALWPDDKVAVELDSWTHHRTRAAFERDRARDLALIAAGYRVVRITSRRLERDAGELATLLGGLLSPCTGRTCRPEPSRRPAA